MRNFSNRNTERNKHTTKLDKLYMLAAEKNIPIDESCPKNIKSMSVRFYDGSKVIGLSDDDDTEYTKLERLAHEMGHCMTESFYEGYSPFELREKHEYKANAWATNEIVPFAELCKAVKNGYRELWELAEHFNVSSRFMEKAITIHSLHGRTVPPELYADL